MLETVLVASCIVHSFAMALKNGDHHVSLELYISRLMLTAPILILAIVLHVKRGMRIHIFPLMTGLVSYTFCLVFCLTEEHGYYYYLITSMLSLILVLFFGGRLDFYRTFDYQQMTYPHVGFANS